VAICAEWVSGALVAIDPQPSAFDSCAAVVVNGSEWIDIHSALLASSVWWNMTVSDGIEISLLVGGVWAVAFGIRAVARFLQDDTIQE
jgi:hypothetical protein